MASFSLSRILALLAVLLPLVVGVVLLVAAFRSQRIWVKVVSLLSGIVFLATFAVVGIAIGSYLWALHLESRWYPANPKTQTELESYLSLYSVHDIQPAESEWGLDHKLQPGERMTRYLLLWAAPLDVVYTTNNAVVTIYTSYE